jgi:hypothetical protein
MSSIGTDRLCRLVPGFPLLEVERQCFSGTDPLSLTRSRPRTGAIGEIVSFTRIPRRSCSRRLRVVITIEAFDSPLVRTTTSDLEDGASATAERKPGFSPLMIN